MISDLSHDLRQFYLFNAGVRMRFISLSGLLANGTAASRIVVQQTVGSQRLKSARSRSGDSVTCSDDFGGEF